MKRFLPVAAALAAAFSMSAAQADVVVIDDFSLPLAGFYISDITYAGTTISTANPSTVATNRDLTHTLTTPGAAGSNASKAGIGGAPNFLPNRLNMSNDSDVDSQVTSKWTAGSIVASGPAKFTIDVLSNDHGVGVENYMRARLDGVDLGLLSITSVGTFSWELTAPQLASLADGFSFSLAFDGSNAWDMSVDNLRLEIPEPTSLALVGLALVGAGLASRRRKA